MLAQQHVSTQTTQVDTTTCVNTTSRVDVPTQHVSMCRHNNTCRHNMRPHTMVPHNNTCPHITCQCAHTTRVDTTSVNPRHTTQHLDKQKGSFCYTWRSWDMFHHYIDNYDDVYYSFIYINFNQKCIECNSLNDMHRNKMLHCAAKNTGVIQDLFSRNKSYLKKFEVIRNL